MMIARHIILQESKRQPSVETLPYSGDEVERGKSLECQGAHGKENMEKLWYLRGSTKSP